MRSPQAVWHPDSHTIANANITWLMGEVGAADYATLHEWTCTERARFWQVAVERLGIVFRSHSASVLEGSPCGAQWWPDARMNIVESCFQAPPSQPAIVFGPSENLTTITYGELREAVATCSWGLRALGIGPGTPVAIAMPMTFEAVVAYLAIVTCGGVVVSVADSFAPAEIAARLSLAEARWVVTQDHVVRDGKVLSMYQKVVAAGAFRVIVVETGAELPLRPDDVKWGDVDVHGPFDPHISGPDEPTNVLFSSGTTGEPKAIPWTHLTPIKAATDGHFHHDIHHGEVVAWPTNLGWMMGPWLIYASLINQGTMALSYDLPTGVEFLDFVAKAHVSVLGLVPAVVGAWRSAGLLDLAELSGVRVFSSTGETAVADDMAALSSAAGGRPIIEYCGGTEIGGAYITGTVVQDTIPGLFSTPALGLDLVLMDGDSVSDTGETFLIPPSVGLSTRLLNLDHAEVYYSDVPEYPRPLRRHGDQMERLENGYWRALGRVDDTMNLSGIKVSAAEIERVVVSASDISECAAIAVTPPSGGPDRLVIFVVPAVAEFDLVGGQSEMQQLVGKHLNPLFKIFDVRTIAALPRTASSKVMRRSLRANYQELA